MMRHIIQWFKQIKVKAIILLPFYLFTFLPLNAQVGTWKHYLAYHEVQDICAADQYLFVLASNGLYQYNLNDQSITTFDRINGLSDTHITHIGWSQQAKRLIAVYENANIDLIDVNGNVTNISSLYSKSTTEDKTVTDLRIDGIYAWLVTSFAILKVNMQKAEITDTYTKNHPNYPTSLPEKSTADYDKYIATVSTLDPLGPDYNHFYEAKFVDGKLYTTGGYFLSGMPDPQYPGIIQVYDGNDWTTFEENISEKTGYRYIDINCLDVMPGNPQYVVAGGRTGIYEFNNGSLVRYHNKDNSPLRGAVDRGNQLGNEYVLISGMKFDSNGHLWVLNNQTEGVTLLEFDPVENKWTDHHNEVLTNENGIGKHAFRSMIIDSRGLLWFVNHSWVEPAVFCCDMENDIVLKYDNFVNQDGTRYNVNWITCVCEDKEGNIWVGTDTGAFMIQKKEVGQSSVTFYQVKVPRNDGTDYADYLLNGVSISSIAIDGGNRKWFGSDNAGAFLISADNMQQLQNFNTSNSKLISNNVAYISINPSSGEVFFLSDKGLCSYMSNATEPSETMDDNTVYAYPNPVTPDYDGLITIVGLTYDADVKIIASNGALIAEGRSNGGMFTWDGRDRKGRRVASGIYMVVTATADGNKGTVCKIAVIN
jgi:hypothetical protein